MKNETNITTAANSKTMNAIEKDRLFAAASSAEENPAKVDIEEFDKSSADKKQDTQADKKSAADSTSKK